MGTYRMHALTAEEVSRIAKTAVDGVTAQEIVSNKKGTSHQIVEGVLKTAANGTHKTSAGVPHGSAMVAKVPSTQTLNNLRNSGIQKSLAGSVLSQGDGRSYLKEAFNKVRKG